MLTHDATVTVASTGPVELRLRHWHDHNGHWWLASCGGRPVGEGDTRDECLAEARIRLSADYGILIGAERGGSV